MAQLDVEKGIIFYTNNNLDNQIFYTCQKFILEAGLPIVSCSLKPIDFGSNIVLKGLKPGYPTMMLQIIEALRSSTAKHIFFCEHDVLYHKSHFDFIPPTDHIYYYNTNIWRWDFPHNFLSNYDYTISLSCLCVNRETALKHYEYRYNYIMESGLYRRSSDGQPKWSKRFSYEPGAKSIYRGGITDEVYDRWESDFPVVDIRHSKNFSYPPFHLNHWKEKPGGFKEARMDEIPGWDLKGLFNL